MQLTTYQRFLTKQDPNEKIGELIKIDPATVEKNIIADLGICAQVGSIKQADSNILAMMSTVIIEKFPDLTRKEIVQAFKMAILKELNVDLARYGRPLDLGIVNDILMAYRKKKKFTISEFKRKRQQEIDDQQPKTSCPEHLKIKIEDNKTKLRNKAKLPKKKWTKGKEQSNNKANSIVE